MTEVKNSSRTEIGSTSKEDAKCQNNITSSRKFQIREIQSRNPMGIGTSKAKVLSTRAS